MGTTVSYINNLGTWDVYIPTGIGAFAAAVITPPPGGSNQTAWAATCGINAEADIGLYYVIYPAGRGGAAQTFNCGNNGLFPCCGYAHFIQAPDIQFLKFLTEFLPLLYSIDPTKICFAGYSSGASVTFSFVAAFPSSVAALLTMTGCYIGVYQEAVASIPKTFAHIYGTADLTIPPGGGNSDTNNPFNGNLPYIFPSLYTWQRELSLRAAVITNVPLIGVGHAFSDLNTALGSNTFAKRVSTMIGAL